MNADEYEEIRADIWAEPWKDPSLFPDLLNRAVTELGALAVGDPYGVAADPQAWAATLLRNLGARAKCGIPFDEPTDEPPYWSANL